MLSRCFRRQKAAAAGRCSMSQAEAVQFMTDVIRPRAAFAAEQFFVERAGGAERPNLNNAIAAMRATVEDFTRESCDLAKLRKRDRAKVIVRLQTVGVDAFLDRITELHRQKAANGSLQTKIAN